MPRTSAERRVFADLEERYGREVAVAFFRALDDLKAQAEIERVIAAIQAGNIEAALEALHIDPEAFAELPEIIRRAYAEGGRATVERMPRRTPEGLALVVRFDPGHSEAAAWLAEHGARLVTGVTEDMRAATRDQLVAGMQRGANPRTVALDIVGRLNRATGFREGGIIGLTSQQAGYVARAKTQLASTDAEELNAYLGRNLRDKRFDRSVAKAIRTGEPIPVEVQAKAAQAYAARLLRHRGETIGRVEAMTAIQTAKRAAFLQGIEAGKFAEDEIERTWRSAGDLRVRHTHVVLNGQKKRGLSEPFVSPSGARLMHPMDTSLGAGMDEIAGCRCDCAWRIRWLDRVR